MFLLHVTGLQASATPWVLLTQLNPQVCFTKGQMFWFYPSLSLAPPLGLKALCVSELLRWREEAAEAQQSQFEEKF